MAKILILAESGFGKTTSIGPDPEIGIVGLNPKETFILTCTNKGLSIPGWKRIYTPATPDGKGNLVMGVSSQPDTVSKIITNAGKREDIKNVIFDDSNYIMQDYYMAKATTSGYDVFKKIGAIMGGIFIAMEAIDSNKNFIMMAHFEEYKNSNLDTLSFRFKTVGKMVQDYITPEGKFEVVLYGKQSLIDIGGKKTILKQFVTNFDGQFPAKSPRGMFKQLYIPNDLGYVVAAVNAYNEGEIFEPNINTHDEQV